MKTRIPMRHRTTPTITISEDFDRTQLAFSPFFLPPCSPVRDPATNYFWIITAEGASPVHSFDPTNTSQYKAN